MGCRELRPLSSNEVMDMFSTCRESDSKLRARSCFWFRVTAGVEVPRRRIGHDLGWNVWQDTITGTLVIVRYERLAIVGGRAGDTFCKHLGRWHIRTAVERLSEDKGL